MPAVGAPHTIFISYSQADRAYVERLNAHLTAAGLRCWFDHNMVRGESFPHVIAAQIRACAAVVVVMTPAAADSRWVNNEVHYAEQHDKPLLPLLLDGKPLISVATLDFDDVRGGRMPSARLVERLRALSGVIAARPDLPPATVPALRPTHPSPPASRADGAPTRDQHPPRPRQGWEPPSAPAPPRLPPTQPQPPVAPSTEPATSRDPSPASTARETRQSEINGEPRWGAGTPASTRDPLPFVEGRPAGHDEDATRGAARRLDEQSSAWSEEAARGAVSSPEPQYAEPAKLGVWKYDSSGRLVYHLPPTGQDRPRAEGTVAFGGVIAGAIVAAAGMALGGFAMSHLSWPWQVAYAVLAGLSGILLAVGTVRRLEAVTEWAFIPALFGLLLLVVCLVILLWRTWVDHQGVGWAPPVAAITSALVWFVGLGIVAISEGM